MAEFDENGDPIVTENEEGEPADDTDYKSLWEKEKAEKEKFEGRFKSTAKQLNELKKTPNNGDSNVQELVSKQVQEEMYYANNPVAKEYQKEIKDIQSKTGMTPEDAMTFYLAKYKPELITKKADVWVDWISKTIEPTKDIKDMTYEELRPKGKTWG